MIAVSDRNWLTKRKRKWQINVTDRRKERNKMKKGWKENRQKKKVVKTKEI